VGRLTDFGGDVVGPQTAREQDPVVRDQVADEAPIERNASAWDGGIEHDDVGGVLIDAADRRAPGHHHLDHGLHAGSDASGDLRRLVAMQLGGGEAERSRDLEDLAGRVVPKDADRHGVVWNDRQDRSRYLDVDAATRRGDEVEPDRVDAGADGGDRIGGTPDPTDLHEHSACHSRLRIA